MKMKVALLSTLTLALFAGAAQAQTSPAGALNEYQITPTSPATVTQDLNVTVPTRFGLVLHRSVFNLDLGSPTLGDATDGAACYRAGEHNTATGRDTLYDISALMGGTQFTGDSDATNSGLGTADDPNNPYDVTATQNQRSNSTRTLTFPTTANFVQGVTIAGSNSVPFVSTPVSGYPGAEFDADGNLVWKGPIFCTFQTIVQKYANTTNWTFTAELNAPEYFPTTYVADRVTSIPALSDTPAVSVAPVVDGGLANSNGVLLSGPQEGIPQPLLVGSSTTGGWLDDNLLLALVFDGSEVGGDTYTATITYRLADTSTTGL